MKTRVIMHADDYGACAEVSAHILDCIRVGKLYSLSILPNSPYLFESLRLLKKEGGNIHYSIHFNIAEGPALSLKKAALLTDEKGMFNISFFKVLLCSLTPKRKALKSALKAELSAQLKVFLDALESAGIEYDRLRIDSHQHYHMIPLVLETILETARESGREIEFIRIPSESLIPYLRHPKVLFSCRFINLVKNLVLSVLSVADRKMLLPFRGKTAVFTGIMMSGHMDKKRVTGLLPDFCRIAGKRGLPLEILSHPGGVDRQNTGTLMDVDNKGCLDFYTSKGRRIEKQMIMDLKLPHSKY